MKKRKWVKKDIDWLINNYPSKGRGFCAKKLNRSDSSIRAKTSKLKLYLDTDSDFFKEFQARAASSKIGKKRPEHSILMAKYAEEGKLNTFKKLDELTPDERIFLSNRVKESIIKHGHPKGMLGKTHTKEVKEIVSKTFKRMWEDENSILNSDEHRQKLSDRMSKQQSKGGMRNNYSNAKRGMVTIGKNTFFARSSWECNIGAYLEFLKKQKQIKNWEHEPETFWFLEIKRGVRSYLPDFKVYNNDGTFYFIEVKGWMDAKSKTKLKRMKKYYPDIKLELIDKDRYLEISKSKGLFKGWGMLDSDSFLQSIRKCEIKDCDNKYLAKGLCSKHYYRAKKRDS